MAEKHIMRMTQLRLWASAMLLIPGWLPAQGAHVPTLVESLSRPALRSPAIAPDGAKVAYLRRETDWKNDEFVWQLWLADVAGGNSVQLTQGRKSISSPQWSFDGRWLAFITEREGNALESPPGEGKDKEVPEKAKTAAKQIWIMAPDGGEAWQASQSETDVEQFHWSRHGGLIVFTAEAPESKANKSRSERYSGYQVIEKDYRQTQLWSIDAQAAALRPGPVPARRLLNDLSLNVNGFDVAPDGAHIVFSATRTPLLADGKDEDVYLLDLSGAAPAVKLVALPGPDGSPLFSPDGKQIAFATSLAQPYFYYANEHIAQLDIDAARSRPVQAVSELHDLSKGFDEEPQLLAFSPAGLYFAAFQKTASQIFRLDPATGRIEAVTAPNLIVDEASATPDGKRLAFVAEDPTHLSELYVSALDAREPKRLTDLTAAVRDWKLGSVEVVSWKSKDGALIEGVLHKPADYDPKRKYPLLVKIHGGPTGVSQPRYLPPDYAYPLTNFLAEGALVLEPNYRGSAGYGAAFRALNVRNLGVGDMWDVMSGIDSLIAKGLVDPDRLASMGWSQGGYISAFLTTHTNRFKAISVGAGISDWTTYYVSTDITPFTPQYLHATPWDDPAIYAKTSPMTTIRQARTPTLIQHGSMDRRVPVPNAFELLRGLLDQHVDARLILYNGFGHGINKPKSQLALEQANLDWFNHYLWNAPIPADSPLQGTSELPVEDSH